MPERSRNLKDIWATSAKHINNCIIRSKLKARSILLNRVCPILPDDVLRCIFILCLPIGRNAFVSKRQAPLVLTQVCNNWRLVALSTPALWATIHLLAPEGVFPTNKRFGTVSRIVSGLERSGCRPLSISLSIKPNDEGYWRMDSDISLFDTFLSLSHRWRDFNLACLNDVQRLLQLSAADVPLLQSLTIDCGGGFEVVRPVDEYDMSDALWRQTRLFQVPTLKSIKLFNTLGNPICLPLKWAQMTHLSLRGTGFTLDDLAFIFRTCSVLTSFSSRIVADDPGNLTDSRRILCPHLSELSIFDFHDNRRSLYQILDLPSLHRLDYFQFPPSPTLGTLAAFSLSYGIMSSLRHLVTNPRLIPHEVLIAWLRLCPRLESLSFVPGPIQPEKDVYCWVGVTVEVLELLSNKLQISANSNEEYLCPNLSRFECLFGSAFFEHDFLAFVRTKQAQADPRIAKLTHVVVFFKGRQQIDMYKELSPFCTDHLETYFVYHARGSWEYIRGCEWDPELLSHCDRLPRLSNPFIGQTKEDEREIRLGIFGRRFNIEVPHLIGTMI